MRTIKRLQLKVREHDRNIFQKEEPLSHQMAFDENTSYDQQVNELYRSGHPSDGCPYSKGRASQYNEHKKKTQQKHDASQQMLAKYA